MCGVTVPAHVTQPTRAFMRRYWYRFSIINPRRDVEHGNNIHFSPKFWGLETCHSGVLVDRVDGPCAHSCIR
jgi:hypothetical protein